MHHPSPLLQGSLYELATGEQSSATSTQLSPATFKSLVDSLLSLLAEQQIAAVVWAKLPRGEVWQTALQQYSRLSASSNAVYLVRNASDESATEITTPCVSSPDDTEQPLVFVELPVSNPFRREYFVVVWSAVVQIAIVARRQRLRKSGSEAAELETIAGDPGNEDNPERKQLLDVICHFDAATVKPLMAHLAVAVQPELSSTDAPANQASTEAIANIVNIWQQQVAAITVEPTQTDLLQVLFIRQLQQQEENWQRASSYRKQAELAEILQVQNEELSSVVQLKDDFLSNVGQELRTPLTTIKTALTLLVSPSLRPPQRQRYMDLIAKECDRQSSLITSLLDLVQIDQAAKEATIQPLRLADIVPGMVSTYQPLAEEKGVMLAYTVPEDLPPIVSVSNWVKQIVINLLHNGIKFTPRGGQVWVRARQQDSAYVELEIRDTGVGIAASEIPKIFDRFYRVRQPHATDTGGAGLGLTIVQQLLVHCGGSITVKSRLGEGSTFTVSFPTNKG